MGTFHFGCCAAKVKRPHWLCNLFLILSMTFYLSGVCCPTGKFVTAAVHAFGEVYVRTHEDLG